MKDTFSGSLEWPLYTGLTILFKTSNDYTEKCLDDKSMMYVRAF